MPTVTDVAGGQARDQARCTRRAVVTPVTPEETPVPLPGDWAKLHATLEAARAATCDSRIPAPPPPLILAGAAFSSAVEIRGRWHALIRWANEYGFGDTLAAHLPPPPSTDVAADIAGVSDDGVGWWPDYGAQRHEPKRKPSREQAEAALSMLRDRWREIAGSALAATTRPVGFRGAKSRRLLVSADPGAAPPWGSWYSISQNPRVFTAFRAAVNAAIAPLEVDDVSFETTGWSKEE